MINVLAVYGSPRRLGNTALLLREAVKGARESGAEVDELALRDLKLSPCLATYECREKGHCVLRDDFARVQELIEGSRGIILASPIFFYTVSAQTKILMDRCHAFWVRKHLYDGERHEQPSGYKRRGLFISVGATKGKKLFDGSVLTVRYFFDAIDTGLWKSLLYRSLDAEGEVLQHPEYLEEAHQAGRKLVELIRMEAQSTFKE